MTLIQTLLQKGLITKDQALALEYEVKTTGKKEEELILEKGIVEEALLFSLKSENLKIPLKEVSPESVPLEVLELIPEDAARYYKMIPLDKKDNLLEIGMVYPEEIRAQEALKFLTRQGGFTYQIFLITLTNFNNLLKQYRTLKREIGKALVELEEELKAERIEIKPTPMVEFERLVEEAPISKVVATILRHAVEGNASDIHIEPTKEKTRIRFRMDGILHSSIFLPIKVHPAIVARIKILSDLKIDETRIPQDGRFSTKVEEKDIDFRVSTFPTAFGEKVALRVLNPKEGLKHFEELGLEGRNFQVVKEAIKRPFGLILSVGPTGCGKTTTQYAILNLLNTEGVNIMTLEDPVEYFIRGVNQSQIRPEIGYDFATGLRHILRQDPDIIMVGEIRDEETAKLVTHATLTGHLVLSTLHTSNAAGAIPRLLDLGVQPFLIPPTLSVVIAQRLVRRLCPECKRKKEPSAEISELILKEIESLPPVIKKDLEFSKPFMIYEALGCKTCNQKGLLGRIGIFEVLEMTDRLAEIIMRAPSDVEIREEAFNQGMITMRQDGIIKILSGITTFEEVMGATE